MQQKSMTSDEFRATRKSMGLTQHQLAAIIGLHQTSIARIETGATRPPKVHAAAMWMAKMLLKNNQLQKH